MTVVPLCVGRVSISGASRGAEIAGLRCMTPHQAQSQNPCATMKGSVGKTSDVSHIFEAGLV